MIEVEIDYSLGGTRPIEYMALDSVQQRDVLEVITDEAVEIRLRPIGLTSNLYAVDVIDGTHRVVIGHLERHARSGLWHGYAQSTVAGYMLVAVDRDPNAAARQVARMLFVGVGR